MIVQQLVVIPVLSQEGVSALLSTPPSWTNLDIVVLIKVFLDIVLFLLDIVILFYFILSYFILFYVDIVILKPS